MSPLAMILNLIFAGHNLFLPFSSYLEPVTPKPVQILLSLSWINTAFYERVNEDFQTIFKN